MIDQPRNPTVAQKVAGKLLLRSSLTQDLRAYDGGFQCPAMSQRQFKYGNYTNAALQYPMLQPCKATREHHQLLLFLSKPQQRKASQALP